MTWVSPRGLRRRSIPKWSLASDDDELANNATKCWDGGNSSLGSSSNENVLLDNLYKNKLEMEASKQTIAELKLEVSCSSANPYNCVFVVNLCQPPNSRQSILVQLTQKNLCRSVISFWRIIYDISPVVRVCLDN